MALAELSAGEERAGHGQGRSPLRANQGVNVSSSDKPASTTRAISKVGVKSRTCTGAYAHLGDLWPPLGGVQVDLGEAMIIAQHSPAVGESLPDGRSHRKLVSMPPAMFSARCFFFACGHRIAKLGAKLESHVIVWRRMGASHGSWGVSGNSRDGRSLETLDSSPSRESTGGC